MDQLDDLLRATFHSREGEAQDTARLAAAARTGHARRTAKRRQVVAVTAAGVLAVGGSSALALARHGLHPSPGAATASAVSSGPRGAKPTSSPGGAPTTAGRLLTSSATRAWSSHGLQVLVPQAWAADDAACGAPTAGRVLIDDAGASFSCPPVHATAASDVVAFGTSARVPLSPEPALHPTNVDGHSAQTGTERLPDGRTAAALVVPDLDVSVAVTSIDPALVGGIMGSARIVEEDSHGCPSRIPTVKPAGSPGRAGAQNTMVPDHPVKAVICHYPETADPGDVATGGPIYLAVGTEVPADQVGDLARVLDSLKPGLGTSQSSPGACISADHDGYLFRFSYASGAPVDVYLHTKTCDHLGFSNGAVTGYVSAEFLANTAQITPGKVWDVSDAAVK